MTWIDGEIITQREARDVVLVTGEPDTYVAVPPNVGFDMPDDSGLLPDLVTIVQGPPPV